MIDGDKKTWKMAMEVCTAVRKAEPGADIKKKHYLLCRKAEQIKDFLTKGYGFSTAGEEDYPSCLTLEVKWLWHVKEKGFQVKEMENYRDLTKTF